MNANEPLTPDAQLKLQERSRKRKAILAGGVVLGLGAAVTLAAWSDDVFADGIFSTGAFELQGNVTADGTVENGPDDWEDYDVDDTRGTLAFNTPSQVLVPNVEVYAPIALRLSPETTIDAASVVLDSVEITTADSPLVGQLAYTVHQGDAAGACAAGTVSGTVVASGTVNSTEPSGTFGTLTAVDGATAQQVMPLCLGIKLTSNGEDVQGVGPTTVTWQFNAQSADE